MTMDDLIVSLMSHIPEEMMREIVGKRLEIMNTESQTNSEKREAVEPRVYSGMNKLSEILDDISVLQNPNLDSESSPSSCVRDRSKEQRLQINMEERSRKKRKVVRSLEVEPIRTSPPEWLLNVMRRKENGYNPKLISTRKLYQSDVDKLQARLSVPFNEVKSPDFLTEEETRIIDEQAMNLRKEGVIVDLVDPQLNKHVLDLKKWNMSGNWYYVFNKGWNDVVSANRFKVDDFFPLWSFRSRRGKLCFALVPPPTISSSYGGGSTSGESGRGNSLSCCDGASTSAESGYVPVPPSPPARDSSHSGQGCTGESSSRSS